MLDLTQLHSAIRHENGLSRRLFLAYGAALSSLPLLASQTQAARRRKISFSSNPFSLGVASGDPVHDGVVLWTKLAPKPLEPQNGVPPEAIEVQWEIARDEALKDVVQHGTTLAAPELGHAVHVEVTGLQPDRWYWFRFHAGDATSPIGRTRTLPAPAVLPEQLKFAFASCQHYEYGLYTAYEHMAKDDLDLVFHLGDYIYEYEAKDNLVRQHVGGKCKSLDDYRTRHNQYRMDPLLQNMHTRCPWFVTWDDHEVENNYAGDIPQKEGVTTADFLTQRAAAYQAYYEMMPLRGASLPQGPHMQLYRKATFGRLAEFMILDTRQYRSDQPNGDGVKEINEATLAPEQSLLGKTQSDWLKTSLQGSQGTWNVLAQQVMMGMVDLAPGEATKYAMDQWSGCAGERIELVRFLADRKISNPVVLTGDIHSNWVNDLRVDDRQNETPVIATEFVGTSISSGGNGTADSEKLAKLLSENPGTKFLNRQRGYVRCTLNAKDWRSDFVVVEDVTKPGAPAVNRASFIVEAGHPGAHTA
ncbi:MAG: alkaline phosphatase D family protein [Planctomycetota bacterium]